MKEISLSRHAEYKLQVLDDHGFTVTKHQIEAALESPDRTERGYGNRIIFQKGFDQEHVLRVVCEEREDAIIVITLYPARRERYETKI